MRKSLDQLVGQYERGSITRRELLATLSALVATAPVSAQQAVGPVQQLNHVTLFVPNVERSVDFYQRLLGMPVLTPQPPGINLRAGAGFVGIYPSQGQPASINHFCLGLDNFDADSTLGALKDRGLAANIRMRGDTKELYFTDPDGIRVQLQDASYIGGVGPLGNRQPG